MAQQSAFGLRGPFGPLNLFIGLGTLGPFDTVGTLGGVRPPTSAYIEEALEAEASSNSSVSVIFTFHQAIPGKAELR